MSEVNVKGKPGRIRVGYLVWCWQMDDWKGGEEVEGAGVPVGKWLGRMDKEGDALGSEYLDGFEDKLGAALGSCDLVGLAL